MKGKVTLNNQAENWQAKSLPKLIDHDSNVALSIENRTWAMKFSEPENIGKIHDTGALGVVIQNSGNYNVRCISVFDHFECRIGLALLKETFDSIRVNFELDYVVVVPFIPSGKEEDSDEAPENSQSHEVTHFDVV